MNIRRRTGAFRVHGSIPRSAPLRSLRCHLAASAIAAGLLAAVGSTTAASATATAPSAPRVVQVAYTADGLEVLFVGSWDDGGSPITEYTASCSSSDGGAPVSDSGFGVIQSVFGSHQRKLLVAGATAGKTYTCEVDATNAAGTGAATASVNHVSIGLPTVQVLDAQTTETTIALKLVANGTGVGATCTAGSPRTASKIATGATTLTVTHLTKGQTYLCKVHAFTATNAGPEQTIGPFIAGRPAYLFGSDVFFDLPPIPRDGGVEVLVQSGNFSTDGGQPITGYGASCSSSGEITKSATNPNPDVIVTGLTNNKPYTCTTTAINANGASIPSPATSAVIVGRPAPPNVDSIAVGDQSLTLTVSDAFDNLPATAGYDADCTSLDIGVSGHADVDDASDDLVVAPLTNGQRYTCSLTETNGRGTGPATTVGVVTASPLDEDPAPNGILVGRPDAPTEVEASASPGSISVDGNPSGGDGGSDITGYTATCISPDGGARGAASNATLPIVVPSLTDGNAYTCRLLATNAGGDGDPSDASNAVIPGRPTEPVVSLITPADHEASVVFDVPSDDGGSTITGYSARCESFDDGTTADATGPSSPLVLTELTNGSFYGCWITATNADGPGVPAFEFVVPGPPPGAPHITNVIPGDGRLTVVFDPATTPPAADTVDYTATCTSSNGGVPRHASTSDATQTALGVTGLSNNKNYTCTVTAASVGGDGPASAPSAVVRPALPTAPRAVVSAAAHSTSITVSFTPPASNGGFALSGYATTCTSTNGGKTRSASGRRSPLEVTGLTIDKTYTCGTSAMNGQGMGVGAKTPAVKLGVPTAPRNPAAVPGNGSINVTVAAPASNGGFVVNGYTATCGGITKTSNTASITVTGLTNGITYACSVAARNSHGTGLPTTTPAVKAGLPGPVLHLDAQPGAGTVTFTYAAPVGLGGFPLAGYDASCTSSNGGAPGSQSVGAIGTITVSGLTNAASYTCTVVTHNTHGAGTGVSVAVVPFA